MGGHQLKQLTEVFAIDICAYAVMHNHTHIVVKIDQNRALSWSRDEIITRWTALYKPSPIVARYLDRFKLTKAENCVVSEDIEKWRHRLYDISWFIYNLNETISRRANEEDGCSGHFWEGQFKNQALLDVADLLTCMSYVDLNTIWSGLADRPITSDFTSIQERIRHYDKQLIHKRKSDETKPPALIGLVQFTGGEFQDKKQGAPFSLTGYLDLSDWTGRAIRVDKTSTIPAQLSPILEHLNINPELCLDTRSTLRQWGSTHPIQTERSVISGASAGASCQLATLWRWASDQDELAPTD